MLKVVSHRPYLLASLSEVRPIDRQDISFDPIDSWVLDDVYWFGVQGYEGILTAIWIELCSVATSIVEIGGNVGLYTVLGAKATQGTYTVVEPLPEVAGALRSNLRRNALPGVEVLEGAAIPDSHPAIVRMRVPDAAQGAPTGAHIVGDVEVDTRETEREIVAQGIPVERLFVGRDLIKLDAEGTEHALLKSARAGLIKSRPTIVVEVLPESHRLAAVLRDLAASAGYQIDVVPEYGSDTIVRIPTSDFTADTPARFHSKDVILSNSAMAAVLERWRGDANGKL